MFVIWSYSLDHDIQCFVSIFCLQRYKNLNFINRITESRKKDDLILSQIAFIHISELDLEIHRPRELCSAWSA